MSAQTINLYTSVDISTLMKTTQFRTEPQPEIFTQNFRVQAVNYESDHSVLFLHRSYHDTASEALDVVYDLFELGANYVYVSNLEDVDYYETALIYYKDDNGEIAINRP